MSEGGRDLICLFLAPQKMKKKDSVEIAAIAVKYSGGEFCCLLETKIGSVKWSVIGEGFEVIVNQQINFIKADLVC